MYKVSSLHYVDHRLDTGKRGLWVAFALQAVQEAPTPLVTNCSAVSDAIRLL